MKPEHRYMVAFIAASRHAGRVYTHVHDHDAGAEIAVGGVALGSKVDVVEGPQRVRISGDMPDLLHHGSQSYIHLVQDKDGFSGYDHASQQHFVVVFNQGAVQVYDHETGRYHAFRVT